MRKGRGWTRRWQRWYCRSGKPGSGWRCLLSAREALDLAPRLDTHHNEIRRLAGEPEAILPF